MSEINRVLIGESRASEKIKFSLKMMERASGITVWVLQTKNVIKQGVMIPIHRIYKLF
jgi:hypothetical protein